MSIALSTPATSEMVIRSATRNDMTTVADFVKSSADWYRPIVSEADMAEHDVDLQWAETNFRNRDFYIGRVGGEEVGTISLQYFGDYAYLGYIYLDTKHIGKGFGQQLMQFAEQRARNSGMNGMALIAHPEAIWAKRAYLKYGFRIIESEKEQVISWENGALEPYYEEGFELYLYEFDGNS